jgi:hypothetical protein
MSEHRDSFGQGRVSDFLICGAQQRTKRCLHQIVSMMAVRQSEEMREP